MTENRKALIDKLSKTHSLSAAEYLSLLSDYDEDLIKYAEALADKVRREIYGNKIFIRGLIEVSNICKNDCYYCGIRAGNKDCERYRLNESDILDCCRHGYDLGFRTFVLQGGEDAGFSDEVLISIIKNIKKEYPDCAVTLSLGERSKESYMRLKSAGADRYLLRHETANPEHYKKLHPENMSHENRLECLKNLRNAGFQVGCGFMVGSPYQTVNDLAHELKFIEEFRPDMCGIGPFIPHKNTPFRDMPKGSPELTCYLLSRIRLIYPTVLLPATTALGTAAEDGREMGIKSGANVIMPNLSPKSVRKKYELYNNKLYTGAESAEEIERLKAKFLSIGYEIVTDRGDINK